jgi:hypothetical protein
MKCLCVLLCVLLFSLGCAADGDKSMWDDFKKDLRGDNMEMRGFPGINGPPPVKVPERAESDKG